MDKPLTEIINPHIPTITLPTMNLDLLQSALEAFVFLAVPFAAALALWPEPAVEPEPDQFDDFDTQPQCEEFYAAE